MIVVRADGVGNEGCCGANEGGGAVEGSADKGVDDGCADRGGDDRCGDDDGGGDNCVCEA